MNHYARIGIVASCLFASIMYGQQRFNIDNPATTYTTVNLASKLFWNMYDIAMRDSEELNFEHAFFDWQHYYGHECGRPISGMDWQVVPFYTYLKTMNSKPKPATDTRGTTQFGGAQFQIQLNFHNFYFRANTAVGMMKTTFTDETIVTKDAEHSCFKFSGVDDVTTKIGYDWYFCDDDNHAGIYVLGGFPGNTITVPTLTISNINTTAFNVTDFGIGCYRAGVGFNTAFTLRNCGDHRLTWHADVQYANAFLKTIGTSTYDFTLNEVQHIPLTIKYTPGQFVSAWTALHWTSCKWGFEVGSMFETMLDEKFIVNGDLTGISEQDALNLGKSLGIVEVTTGLQPGFAIKFTAKPYVATSYNTTICNNPFTMGLGVSYEYDKMQTGKLGNDVITRSYNALQGVNVWGNFTYSF